MAAQDLKSIRQYAVDILKPRLPKTWKLVPYGSNLDALEAGKFLAMLILNTVTRAPEAPNGALKVTFSFFIVVPNLDPAKREDVIDDGLTDFLWAIEPVANMQWDTAQRTVFQNNIAYEVTLSMYFEPEE